MSFETISFREGKVFIIDQRLLPFKEKYIECKNYEQVALAIENMAIRGAPAIGIAAGFALALGALSLSNVESPKLWWKEFERMCLRLSKTRPTAINLFWAIERMKRRASSLLGLSAKERASALEREARVILKEDIECNRKMASYGAELLEDGDSVLTHCNAGALATGGYGTALGVIRYAISQGKRIKVIADETRPLLQGARLTVWELKKDKIPVVLITDNMAGALMGNGKIDKVIVGADRIAENGDSANKIGTYSLAVLAKEHKIPFYIVAPTSTIDLKCKSGNRIPIEERDAREVREIFGKRVVPDDVSVFNFAFDVTPAKLISAIITERGIVFRPNRQKVRKLFKNKP